MDLSALLPEDVFVEVHRRLAPRSLAASRCVCKAWKAVIDAHRLLRAELLPHSLAGIYINFRGLHISEFFSRPPKDPSVSGGHTFVAQCSSSSRNCIKDHCNGLLLFHDYVLNPATQWSAPLPPAPPPRMGRNSIERGQLVYDPTIDPHYKVFLIPHFHYKSCGEESNLVAEQSEWPPSPCFLNVYSSKEECWEVRSFVREGEPAGTVDDMRSYWPEKHNAVYWRRALYVYCQSNCVIR